MSNSFKPVSNDISESLPKPEASDINANAIIENAVREAGELEEGGASWLEELFKRMFGQVTDTFDRSLDGVESETISPERAVDAAADTGAAQDISEAAKEWHVQEGNESCAVCSQQFIINEFLDLDVTEAELCEIAETNGWFDPERGTAVADVGKLLEYYGIDTHVNREGTIQDIKDTLDRGGRVIVSVDSMVFWKDGFGNYPISGADHAIEVIGIDDSDPLDVKVIVNDSGIDNGCGRSVSLLEFMEAWTPGGGFMVSAFPRD